MDYPQDTDLLSSDVKSSSALLTDEELSIQDSLKEIQRALEDAKHFDHIVSIYESAFAILNPALAHLRRTRQEIKVFAVDDRGHPLEDTNNNPVLKDFTYEDRLS